MDPNRVSVDIARRRQSHDLVNRKVSGALEEESPVRRVRVAQNDAETSGPTLLCREARVIDYFKNSLEYGVRRQRVGGRLVPSWRVPRGAQFI
jgi:hypothetical protein